jgi:thiosulfate dehydrogenase
MRALAAALAGLLLAASCSDGPVPAADYGEELFNDPGFSASRFNDFSCATCHSTEPEAPDPGPRIAYSLHDTVARPTWWNGQAARLLDAVDFCYVYFMRGEPLDPASPEARALYEYLVRISPGAEAPPLPMSVVENVSNVGRGEVERGREVYDAVCATCHGEPHTGNGRLGPLVSIIPEASIEFAEEQGVAPALVVIEKVRHGQFFGIGGNMPLFTREALSDEDLAAILAYLEL